MKLRRKGGNMLCTLWVYKYYLFSIKPCKGEIITPVSQIRQMRLGEVKRHTQNHTAREDKAGIFNPDISGSNISIFFFFTFFSIFFFPLAIQRIHNHSNCDPNKMTSHQAPCLLWFASPTQTFGPTQWPALAPTKAFSQIRLYLSTF